MMVSAEFKGKAIKVVISVALIIFNLFMLPFLVLFVWNEVISECISVIRPMDYIEAFILFWSMHIGVGYYKKYVSWLKE